MGKTKHASLARLFWWQDITAGKLHFNNHSRYHVLLNWLKHPGLKAGKKQILRNWQNCSLVSNTNLYYYLISEETLVQQASLYTENRAIMLLIKAEHGTIHGYFVKIREQTLPWLNQRMKTNSFTTCWGILLAPALDGLGCIGELIRNCIGLMAALRREIIISGRMASQITMEARRIVLIF